MSASNTPRSLDAIGADLRKLRNIFDSGQLLTEAREACEHGEWLYWLETYFDASEDTAENHMAAFRLSRKFRTVRNLKLPPTIVYDLGKDIDDPDLPAIIEALVKAEKPLSAPAAKIVVGRARLRVKHGDHSLSTLFALEIIPDDAAWSAGASAELKSARPTTDEEADKIVLAYHRKHLETLFGGALPDWLDNDMLGLLDEVEPEHRAIMLAKLRAASQPLDWRQLFEITRVTRDDEDEDGDDADGDAPTPAPIVFDGPDLDAELLQAVRVIVHHARRPMPTSVGGIEGAELVEAARFLDKLHELATGGSAVKRIADAADRSRSGRAS